MCHVRKVTSNRIITFFPSAIIHFWGVHHKTQEAKTVRLVHGAKVVNQLCTLTSLTSWRSRDNGIVAKVVRTTDVCSCDVYLLKSREGGTPKIFWRGVWLRFSIGYPWLRKFCSKRYPWLGSISWSWAHFYMICRNFSTQIPFLREIFRKQTLI